MSRAKRNKSTKSKGPPLYPELVALFDAGPEGADLADIAKRIRGGARLVGAYQKYKMYKNFVYQTICRDNLPPEYRTRELPRRWKIKPGASPIADEDNEAIIAIKANDVFAFLMCVAAYPGSGLQSAWGGMQPIDNGPYFSGKTQSGIPDWGIVARIGGAPWLKLLVDLGVRIHGNETRIEIRKLLGPFAGLDGSSYIDDAGAQRTPLHYTDCLLYSLKAFKKRTPFKSFDLSPVTAFIAAVLLKGDRMSLTPDARAYAVVDQAIRVVVDTFKRPAALKGVNEWLFRDAVRSFVHSTADTRLSTPRRVGAMDVVKMRVFEPRGPYAAAIKKHSGITRAFARAVVAKAIAGEYNSAARLAGEIDDLQGKSCHLVAELEKKESQHVRVLDRDLLPLFRQLREEDGEE